MYVFYRIFQNMHIAAIPTQYRHVACGWLLSLFNGPGRVAGTRQAWPTIMGEIRGVHWYDITERWKNSVSWQVTWRMLWFVSLIGRFTRRRHRVYGLTCTPIACFERERALACIILSFSFCLFIYFYFHHKSNVKKNYSNRCLSPKSERGWWPMY